MKQNNFLKKAKEIKEKKRNVYGLEVSPELQKKHDELKNYLGITTLADLHRFAITKLYRELILNQNAVA